VPVSATYVAQTQSSQAVNIHARVSGFLDKRVHVEGAVVKAGQVMLRMDQKPFQAQVDAFGAASSDPSKRFTGPARTWSYAGQIIGPIFTVGAVSGQAAQAEAGAQAALYNYRLSIQNAFADVDNALVANQKLQEQLAAQARLVDALRDYSRLARLQFNGGYAPYSTVLQAEQSLFPAELTLAAVRAQVFASSVNIYKAMGGGWVDLADRGTSPAGGPEVPALTDKNPLPPLF